MSRLSPRSLLAPLLVSALVACGGDDKDEDDDPGVSEPDADTDTDTDADADTDTDTDTDADTDADTDTDTDEPLDDVDDDGDGYSEADGDCDDADAAVNPGAAELCNDVDDDCSGRVDDDAVDATAWFIDRDGDGYGDGGAYIRCAAGDGMVDRDGDCDDDDAAVSPAARDISGNGEDEDCDGIDIDIDGCMATLNSPTLYAASPARLYRTHFPLIWETYTVSGVDVSNWWLDEAREYIFAEGIVATPTDDPLVFDLVIHGTWDLGRSGERMELYSGTLDDITVLGFEEDEFSWRCEGTATHPVQFTGTMEFRALGGDPRMNYSLTGRTSSLTAAPLTWSDFTWETMSSFDYFDAGCTQTRADLLAQGHGFADFADMVDVELQSHIPRYLSSLGVSPSLEHLVGEACGEN